MVVLFCKKLLDWFFFTVLKSNFLLAYMVDKF